MNKNEEWFEVFQSNKKSRTTLYCFSHAGGSVAMYYSWAQRLQSLNVVGVELPGRMRRMAIPPFTDFDQLISELVPKLEHCLDGEYVFYGHSLGALIAYEVASRMSRKPAVLCVSGSLPPNLVKSKEKISSLSDDVFLERVAEYGGLEDEILNQRELIELILPILRSDFSLYESYYFRTHRRVDCPLLVMGGDADPHVDIEALRGWSKFTSASCFLQRTYCGGHFFINECREKILMDLESFIFAHTSSIL